MDDILYLFNPWWEQKKFFTGISRDIYLEKIKKNLDGKQALLLVGSRRVGKTTLIYQTIKFLLEKGIAPKHLVYLPLDHPSFSGKKILGILEDVRRLHSFRRETKLFLFLDEVQFFTEWEQEAKAIIDFEKVKLVISGSTSAQILTKGTHLTGRTLTTIVRPFDFGEFTAFQGKKIEKTDTAFLDTTLKKYLLTGGYPEYVEKQNPVYFSDLITNVINKDIVSLFPVKNTVLVSQMLALLADRSSSATSFTKLGKILDLTKDTVKDYCYYLTATFLVSELGKYSSSRNATLYSPKKFYLLDTGLLFNITGRPNLGAAAETAVFQKLTVVHKKIGFYFENQKEIDFATEDGEGFEVKYELSDLAWEKLAETIKRIPVGKFSKITILTNNPRPNCQINNINVDFEHLANFL